MATSPTYPGVYIEELPSGVRTITGVATSITAFIGRALRGPTDTPVVITSYADFERIFGGLWKHSAMSFAVSDFYRNGGSTAIIVRLFHPESGGSAPPAFATITYSSLNVRAASEGAWGNKLRVRVTHDTRPLESGEAADSLFNLFVLDEGSGTVEEFRNLSIEEDHARQADLYVNDRSKLITLTSRPTTRPTKHDDPDDLADIWRTVTPATNASVQTADQASDGERIDVNDFTGTGKETAKEGLYALENADLFNLLCIPPYKSDGNVDANLMGSAASYCEKRRAFLLVDPLEAWTSKSAAVSGVSGVGTSSTNAALFFPRLRMANPLNENRLESFVPCGAVAGVMARTDAQRGVWKAPAGLEATLNSVREMSVPLTDGDIGELNPVAVNCLRIMPGAGAVVWGARTLKGSDRLASEWKYIPIRRLALFLEESLYRGLQWVVFEPNDEPLWSQIRLNVGAFMHNQFRLGAFQGSKPSDAYFVKCDSETTTQNDRDRGVVNIVVGFAPLKPAEFVIVKIQQIAGQIPT